MKQNITVDQLNELSEKALFNYARYAYDKGWSTLDPIKNMPNGDGTFSPVVEPARICLPSIGQLIEFLDDGVQNYVSVYYQRGGQAIDIEGYWNVDVEINKNKLRKLNSELCDALWEAVKEVLESS
jgi:hypothetical protein